jgi:hypothetical protein
MNTNRCKQLSIQELLARQVYALVRETADAVCPKDKNILELEGELLAHLAAECALKRDAAKMFAKSFDAMAEQE